MGITPGKVYESSIDIEAKNPQTITMANNNESVIDLTECSFTLADHGRLNNVVISLDTDDSFHQENRVRTRRGRKRRHSRTRATNTDGSILDLCTPEVKNKPRKSRNESGKIVITDEPNQKKARNSLGTCPICFEDFCGQSLASTKCGHVFCLDCLETALHTLPRCPTCRTSLRGKARYHPIFL